MMPQHLARGAGGVDRRVEVMRHEEWPIGLRARAAKSFHGADARETKKTGRRNESSSRVEVMGWSYEKISQLVAGLLRN